MEMPSGGEVRCPEGPVKHSDDSTLPKATKTEESADSKVNEAGKYLLFCSPIVFSVPFKSREVSVMHRMNQKIQQKRTIRNAEG